jgi:alginate O-acetyltransferase complex protein AlgI
MFFASANEKVLFMVFSSAIFLFFFLPLVIIGYHLLRESFRIYFLMLASLFFYAWGGPKYILVILLSIAVNYLFGILLHLCAEKRAYIRKTLLFLALACNLGILFYYKYLNFAIDNVNRLFGTGFVERNIILPIGISFFTFQGMSYIIDLYRQKIKVQKNPALVAFYIAFFPQLIAGPIIRYADIEGQLYKRAESAEKFVSGVKRFIIGLAKKVLIANSLGYTADLIFSIPAAENTAATAWVGVICYFFQIFFDFSGYSDMAIGLGKMFGFDFRENFNYPYISRSITEFWRRWHISLSSWFRDYVYIPLGGNRTGNVYLHLLIVFVVTGFWHGASFNFLVWGLWHGLFLIIERIIKHKYALSAELPIAVHRFIDALRWALTIFVVIIGWVFFRAEGLREALTYLGIMFGVGSPENVGFTVGYYLNVKMLIVLVFAVAASAPISKAKLFTTIKDHFAWRFATAIMTLLLFYVSIVFVISSSYNPFIYFRF